MEEFLLFLLQFPDVPSHAIPTLLLQIALKEKCQPPLTRKMDWLLASELGDPEPDHTYTAKQVHGALF